jgi:hypothetical protein
MKKSFNSIFALCVLAAFSFVSCDKDVETSPVQIDLSQKGKVEGYVYADLNLTTAGKEAVPAGTKVIVTVKNSDLITGATGNWIDTVFTDSDGKFAASVPTKAAGVSVTINTTDFVADQTQPLTSHYANTPIKKLFTAPASVSATVLPGETKIKIIEYTKDSYFTNFVEFVTIKGKAYAELDNNFGNGDENAPAVDVIFSTDSGWSKKITLTKNTTNTTFSLDVPYDASVYYSFDFTYDIGGKTYRFKNTGKYLSSFGNDDDATSINLGYGEEVK